MSKLKTVTVYSFVMTDYWPETSYLSPFKATKEAIRHSYGAEVLEATAEDVAISSLDDQGRYRRVATGWGELASTC